jgi:hypothetical protein
MERPKVRGEKSPSRWSSEFHRYFPEWADRPTRAGAQREADRNSYLAGGYAEEFGYLTQRERWPAISPLAGDPERCKLWRAQVGALHPGYPECPTPLDREAMQHPSPGGSGAERHSHEMRHIDSGSRADSARFNVIQVGIRQHAASDHAGLRIGLFSWIKEYRIRRRRLNRDV